MFYKGDLVRLAARPEDDEAEHKRLARMLRQLTDNGILEPLTRLHAGSGRHRVYSELEAGLFIIAAHLNRIGLKGVGVEQALISLRARHGRVVGAPEKGKPVTIERAEGPIDMALSMIRNSSPLWQATTIELRFVGNWTGSDEREGLFVVVTEPDQLRKDHPLPVITLPLHHLLKPLVEALDE
jgi:hypothetical protein